MAFNVKGVEGRNVKKCNVIIDPTQRYIFIPVVPGTVNKTEPKFVFDGIVRVEKLTNRDSISSQMKYLFSDGDNMEEWTVAIKEWGNSILGKYGFYADPEVGIFDGKYYVYPTTDGFADWGGHYFKAFSSPDLINWKDEGVILDLKEDVSWSDGNAWAPCIIKKHGKYYYYFSANTDKFEKNVGKAIGVAVCDTPTGKFVDALERPIVYNTMTVTDEFGEEKEMTYPGQVIDPAVFTDPETGKSYLYWGNGSLWVCELNDDMVSLKGVPVEITPDNYREAPHIFYRNGIYYFTWSENDTRNKNYCVKWGYSSSPMGPIVGNEMMIEKNEKIGVYATGHHSVIHAPDTDNWYICYHRFNVPVRMESDDSEYYGTHRELAIDQFTFDKEGKIVQAVATHEGVSEGEEFCSVAQIVECSLPEDEGDVKGVIEVQSGECMTELECIMELYDYQSNLVSTVSEVVEVEPFSTKSVTLTIEAPEKIKGHYVLFFTDDGTGLQKVTY